MPTKSITLTALSDLLADQRVSKIDFIQQGIFNATKDGIELYIKVPQNRPIYKINYAPINQIMPFKPENWRLESVEATGVRLLKLSQHSINEIAKTGAATQYFFSACIMEEHEEQTKISRYVECALDPEHSYVFCNRETKQEFQHFHEQKFALRSIYLSAKNKHTQEKFPAEPIRINLADNDIYVKNEYVEALKKYLIDKSPLLILTTTYPLLANLNKGCHHFENTPYEHNAAKQILKKSGISCSDSDRSAYIFDKDCDKFKANNEVIHFIQKYPHLTPAVAVIASLCQKIKDKELLFENSKPLDYLLAAGFKTRLANKVISLLKNSH